MPKSLKVVFKRKRYGHKLTLYITESPEGGYHYIIRPKGTAKTLLHESLSEPHETITEAILAALEHTLADYKLRRQFFKAISPTKCGEEWTRAKYDLFNTEIKSTNE